MPPNPQICLLSAADFMVLTLWFQGAILCPPPGNKSLNIFPQPSLSHLVFSIPRKNFCPTCSRLRFNQVVRMRGSWVKYYLLRNPQAPRLSGVSASGLPLDRSCLNLQVLRLLLLYPQVLLLYPQEGQEGLPYVLPSISLEMIKVRCFLLCLLRFQERVRNLLTEANYEAVVIK